MILTRFRKRLAALMHDLMLMKKRIPPKKLATLEAPSSCIDPTEIRRTDQLYEQSLLTGDLAFLDSLLADEFVWVHNHANMIESKESLLERIRTSQHRLANKSRFSSEVVVRKKGSAAVVSGYTTVERHDEFVRRTDAPQSAKYHFMRTYVLVDDKCLLLASQTMLVWDSNQRGKHER